jgi:molybdopterin converting factor small subunit
MKHEEMDYEDHRQFIAALRQQAGDMELVGGPNVGAALNALIERMERYLARQDNQVVTLSEAKRSSGYSYDHLRKLVASGAVPNAGGKGRPKLRRRDIPRKPHIRWRTTAYDVTADVASIRKKARGDV